MNNKILTNKEKFYDNNEVISTHNAGFFSCCSVKLFNIVNFVNKNKRLPNSVNSSKQFRRYKNYKNKDITFDYFEHYENVQDVNIIHPIKYHHEHQFINYSNLGINISH